jgi:hypothetical protein
LCCPVNPRRTVFVTSVETNPAMRVNRDVLQSVLELKPTREELSVTVVNSILLVVKLPKHELDFHS